MSLFGSLKKTVNHINTEVSEYKKLQPIMLFRSDGVDPAPNIPILKPEEIEIKVTDLESRVKNLQVRFYIKNPF